jgi:hypothetical protein
MARQNRLFGFCHRTNLNTIRTILPDSIVEIPVKDNFMFAKTTYRTSSLLRSRPPISAMPSEKPTQERSPRVGSNKA